MRTFNRGGFMKFKLLILIVIFTLIGLTIQGLVCNEEQAETEVEKPGVILTSVYDNYKVKEELKSAWGISTVVETASDRILFDTGGDSEILLSNMEKMGVEPDSINKVVISHIHADHLGGLDGFLEKNNDVTVFIPESFPGSVKSMITGKGAECVEVSNARKISDFVYTTGELSGPPIEQSLIIDSKKGVVVLTGCAHPGIVRIVKTTKEMMEVDKVHLVVGGFHHPPLSVVKEFREIGVEKVAPTHCSGDPVREAFAKEYGDNYIEYGLGKIVEVK
jgi:7,8-dihydropterin-6-yl-methyl-4-(beta-D-ribofuranosyl)aminobenzene 5'-phosphate synthase